MVNLATNSVSNFSIKNNVRLVLEDVITKKKIIIESHNMVLTAGLDWISKKISNATPTYLEHCELGWGTTAASPSDADLEIPKPATLIDITESSYFENTASFNTFYALDSAVSGVGEYWTEAGLYDDSGILIARVIFSPLHKENTQTLTIFWDFIFNREV